MIDRPGTIFADIRDSILKRGRENFHVSVADAVAEISMEGHLSSRSVPYTVESLKHKPATVVDTCN